MLVRIRQRLRPPHQLVLQFGDGRQGRRARIGRIELLFVSLRIGERGFGLNSAEDGGDGDVRLFDGGSGARLRLHRRHRLRVAVRDHLHRTQGALRTLVFIIISKSGSVSFSLVHPKVCRMMASISLICDESIASRLPGCHRRRTSADPGSKSRRCARDRLYLSRLSPSRTAGRSTPRILSEAPLSSPNTPRRTPSN